MKNPFLQRFSLFMLYVAWWILPGGIHFFVLSSIYQADTSRILLDAILSFSLFLIFGLSIWYMVRYSDISRKINGKMILNHVYAMILIFVLWNVLSALIISLIYPDYYEVFLSSMTWRVLVFLPFYFLLIIVYYLFASTDILRDKELINSQMETQLRLAELNALKAQINPHFLFNSLNSATALTLTNPEAAREMIVNISNFFRFSLMAGKQPMVPLQEEIENALLYLEIEKGRFGDKIEVDCSLPDSLATFQVPAMILQPIVENCVKHSVYESAVPILIQFRFQDETDFFQIQIENNLDESPGNSRKGTQTGLRNVNSRMALMYGMNGLLDIEKSSERYQVSIKFPKNEQDGR